jgi:uncharacterized membrane protein
MAGFIRVVAAVFCVLCVLAICIAPLVDLPDTNLRSYHLAMLLLFSLMAGATLVRTEAFKPAILTTHARLASPERKKHHQLPPIDTNSILRY